MQTNIFKLKDLLMKIIENKKKLFKNKYNLSFFPETSERHAKHPFSSQNTTPPFRESTRDLGVDYHYRKNSQFLKTHFFIFFV